MKIADSFGICKTNCHNGSYCYLERENYNVSKLQVNDSSYFEISTTLQSALWFRASKLIFVIYSFIFTLFQVDKVHTNLSTIKNY